MMIHTLYVLLSQLIAHYGSVEGDKGPKCDPLGFEGLFSMTCERMKCNQGDSCQILLIFI